MATSYLDQARRDTLECQRRTTRYITRAGGAGASALMGEGASNALDAESRKMAMNARDQIGRYRDQVHTSVKPIAQRIAGQPFRLAKIGQISPGKRSAEPMSYARKECHELLTRAFGVKSDANVEIIDQHPVLDRLHKPSDSMPWLTGHAIKAATVVSTEVTGYGCWWMPKGKEVIYLPPQWVRPVTTDKGLFQAWEMKPEGRQDGTIIPAEDMAYFVHIDPANPMKALGSLEAGIRTVMVQEYVQEALKRAFQLGIHPQMIVKVAAGVDRAGKPIRRRLKKWQMDQIRESVMQRLRGPLNYGLPWFVDALIDEVEPFGHPPNEMDFGMNADKTQAAVEQTFGTNPYIAGAAGIGNRAESAEADKHFVHSTVNPKIEMFSHVLTWCVGPRLGMPAGYVLFIEPCRPHDSEMECNYAKDGNATGKVTVNEYRVKYLGLDPVPWGDAVWAPRGQALIPTENLMGGYIPPVGAGGTAAPATSQLPANDGNGQGAEDVITTEEQDEQVAEGDEPDDESGEAGKAHRPFEKRASDRAKRFDAAFYTRYSKAWLKLHGKQESSLSDALMPLFKQQRNAAVERFTGVYASRTPAQLAKTTGTAIAKRIFKPAEWVKQLKEVAEKQLAHGMTDGARHELAAFGENQKAGPSFDLEFEFGREFPADILDGIEAGLKETLEQDYWSGITDTQLDDLGRTLQEAIDAGESARDLAKSVEDVFDGTMGRERATRIARTESTAAVSRGQQVAREHLHDEGLVDGKEWATTYDMRTRDTHMAANGETRAVKEDFAVGGYPAAYPGDVRLPARERVHCRCAALSTVVQGKGVAVLLLKTCEAHGGRWEKSAWPYQAA